MIGLTALSVLGLAIFSAVALWLDTRGLLNTAENGTLEVGQMILLAIGCVIWAAAAIQRIGSPRELDLRLAAVTFSGYAAIACWLVLGRESSWGSEYGMADSLSDVCEVVGYVIAGLALVACTVYWFRSVPNQHETAKRLLTSTAMLLLFLALVYAGVGAFFDQQVIEIDRHRVLEEAAEFWAYLFPIAARFALPRGA